jgi:hypothetical protein
MVHLLIFCITRGTIILVIIIIIIIIVVVILILIIIVMVLIVVIVVDVVDVVSNVIVVVVVVLIILWQLLIFCCCSLGFMSLRCHNHNLKGLLLLRNILWRDVMWLLLGWHIPWCQLSNWHALSPLAGCVARTNHLKFGNMRD